MVNKFSPIVTKLGVRGELDALITNHPPFKGLALTVRPISCGHRLTDGPCLQSVYILAHVHAVSLYLHKCLQKESLRARLQIKIRESSTRAKKTF